MCLEEVLVCTKIEGKRCCLKKWTTSEQRKEISLTNEEAKTANAARDAALKILKDALTKKDKVLMKAPEILVHSGEECVPFWMQRHAVVTENRVNELIAQLELVTFKKNLEEQVYAYVYPKDNNRTIYLCGLFWKAPEYLERDSQPGILIHEVSHFLGTDDIAYEESTLFLGSKGYVIKNTSDNLLLKAFMDANSMEYEFELTINHGGRYEKGKYPCCGETERYSICEGSIPAYFHTHHGFGKTWEIEELHDHLLKTSERARNCCSQLKQSYKAEGTALTMPTSISKDCTIFQEAKKLPPKATHSNIKKIDSILELLKRTQLKEKHIESELESPLTDEVKYVFSQYNCSGESVKSSICEIAILESLKLQSFTQKMEGFGKKHAELKSAQEKLQHDTAQCQQIAEDVANFHRGTKIADVTGGAVGVTGAVATIAGICLAPFTVGASLAFTAGGLAACAAGGLTSATAAITDKAGGIAKTDRAGKPLQELREHLKDVGKQLEVVTKEVEQMRAGAILAMNMNLPQNMEELQANAEKGSKLAQEATLEVASISVTKETVGNIQGVLEKVRMVTDLLNKICEVLQCISISQ